MPQESVRQIQLKNIVFFFVSFPWVSSWRDSFFFIHNVAVSFYVIGDVSC